MYIAQYKPLILKSEKISKALIKPGNVYKIVVYKYTDGATKTLSGTKTALIFAIGIYQSGGEKELFCIKLTKLKPEKFFVWLKKVFLKNLKDEDIDKAEHLNELIVKSDKAGKKLYSSYIKPSSLTKGTSESPYRTYKLSGIQLVEEVNIKKQILKRYYK